MQHVESVGRNSPCRLEACDTADWKSALPMGRLEELLS
jgi:hypothetical protein